MDYTKEDADELLTRVYKYLDNYNKISHKEYNISASGGYAQSTPGASLSKEDVKALFSKADEHMYQQNRFFIRIWINKHCDGILSEILHRLL